MKKSVMSKSGISLKIEQFNPNTVAVKALIDFGKAFESINKSTF